MAPTRRARVGTSAIGVLTAFCMVGAVGAVSAVGVLPAAAAPGHSYVDGGYELIALTLPAGLSAGSTTALNDEGVIIGQAWSDGYASTGVVWRRGVPAVIEDSSPVAVNGAGQVAGNRYPATGPRHGFVWADGTLTTLAPTSPGPNRFSTVSDIAADGTVVGLSSSDLPLDGSVGPEETSTRATVWHDGVPTDLGTLGGGWSSADLVNDRGQVAGVSQTAADEQHAFLSVAGTLRDLGTLGGTYSWPVAMNNRGQVVGASATADEHTHAVLWDGGQAIDLGVAPGFTDSTAVGINEHGQVLVQSFNQAPGPIEPISPIDPAAGEPGGDLLYPYPSPLDYSTAAFVWTAGQRRALTGIGGTTISPSAISDDGTVVGSATTADGVERPYLWSDGEARRLDGPAPLSTGYANAINRRGQVVGFTNPQGGRQIPLLWQAAV
ncbi:hypothetical protein [Parafrankia sp. FMc2]|uniref:hypothetical protein n=1 Tax=Parafrankia sp. FMc2 TaxID=3233196 RepID=UPI0034D4C409